MSDPLKPDISLLCKIGSIVVHVEEMLSPEGHGFDKIALEQLLADPDICEWRNAMDRMALLPKMRATKASEKP